MSSWSRLLFSYFALAKVNWKKNISFYISYNVKYAFVLLVKIIAFINL